MGPRTVHEWMARARLPRVDSQSGEHLIPLPVLLSLLPDLYAPLGAELDDIRREADRWGLTEGRVLEAFREPV